MSVLKTRTRLIYFRVSEDEYQRFSDICRSSGSRSISDLARSAMERMMQADSPQEAQVSTKLALLEAAVSELSNKVHNLSQSMSIGNGASARAESDKEIEPLRQSECSA